MAQNRLTLDALLRKTLGSSNVYYDPPESFKLAYPCIVYGLSAHNERRADNSMYIRNKRYSLLYITRDADDPMIDTLEDLEYCHLNRPYTKDGLYHYAYDIFY